MRQHSVLSTKLHMMNHFEECDKIFFLDSFTRGISEISHMQTVHTTSTTY